ncbi:MAG: tyrosine-protein phosphatase [Ethanoligenens sp.]
MKRQIATILTFLILGAGFTGAASASSTASPVKINSTADMTHSLGLTGVANARDLGGYKTTNGETVKSGILLRTAALSSATDTDIKNLTNVYDLKQIVDFRTDSEIASATDPTIAGVTNTHISIIKSTSSTTSSAVTSSATSSTAQNSLSQMVAMIKAMGDPNAYMENTYSQMVTSDYSISGYKDFFNILLNRQSGSILYHCTAGKDRTGVASILLLSALGVDKNTVIQDYLLTNQFVQSTVDATVKAAAAAGADQSTQDGIRILSTVDVNWANSIFDAINTKDGSMSQYLNKEMGLTPDKISQLKSMYLESSSNTSDTATSSTTSTTASNATSSSTTATPSTSNASSKTSNPKTGSDMPMAAHSAGFLLCDIIAGGIIIVIMLQRRKSAK